MKRRNTIYLKISVAMAAGLILLLTVVLGMKPDAGQGNTLGNTPHSLEPGLPVTTQITESSKTLRFAVISDLHIRDTDKKAQAKVQKALSDLFNPQEAALDLIVVNGDLGDGLPADYATLNQIIYNARSGAAQKPPLMFTIGNHEFYKAYHEQTTGAWNKGTFPNGETDELAVQRFTEFAGREQVYTDLVVKGYHFIFLGSEKSAMSDPKIGDGVYLSEEQLDWFKAKLKENVDPQKPIFVFLHQPVFTDNSDSPIHTQYVVQHEQLVNILESYPQVVLFSGHLHLKIGAPGTDVHDSFNLFGSSSVTRVRQSSPDASEGLMVTVDGSKVTVQGRDFEQRQPIPQSEVTLDYGIKNTGR